MGNVNLKKCDINMFQPVLHLRVLGETELNNLQDRNPYYKQLELLLTDELEHILVQFKFMEIKYLSHSELVQRIVVITLWTS